MSRSEKGFPEASVDREINVDFSIEEARERIMYGKQAGRSVVSLPEYRSHRIESSMLGKKTTNRIHDDSRQVVR